MSSDDLLRKGFELARPNAEQERREQEAMAADRAYMELRVSEFIQAVDQFLRLMADQGNPGLESISISGATPIKQRLRLGWSLGTPLDAPMVVRALTLSGEFAAYRYSRLNGWYTAADFIREEVSARERKDGFTTRSGDGWRAYVDASIESCVQDLGTVLHRHGIDLR